MKKIFTLLLLLLFVIPLSASDFIVDGIAYNKLSDNEVEVVAREQPYSGDVIIPETVEYDGQSYRVTEIGDRAFNLCEDLTSVTIPESVITIGEEAFAGGYGYVNGSLKTNITNKLTSVVIPNSVTAISKSAFYRCEKLKEIVLSEGVKSIGASAFRQCTELAKITIPNGVTSIEERTFFGCSSLTEVIIPDGVTSIGRYAFLNCESLKEIQVKCQIPPVIDITSFDFTGTLYVPHCSIEVYRNAEYWNMFTSIEAYKVIYEGLHYEVLSNTEVKVIAGEQPYSGDVIIPEMVEYDGQSYRVTEIGDRAFYLCKDLTSVTIPESVITIGEEAFAGDSDITNKLTSIVIPDGVTTIGKKSFMQCSELRMITIGSGVTKIGNSAFSSCIKLETLHVKVKEPPIINLYTFPFGGTTLYVPQGSVEAYRNAEHWNRFFRIEAYKEGAMHRFEYEGLNYETLSYTEVKVVTGIQRYSGEIVIPDTVEYDGQSYRVTMIGYQAFRDCAELTNVTIPEGVTMIDQKAFDGCEGLETVYVKAKLPPVIYDNTFDFITCRAILYVQDGCDEVYRNAEYWNEFPQIDIYKEWPIIRFENNGLNYVTLSYTEVMVVAGEQPYSGEIIIPDIVEYDGKNYQVTKIFFKAFERCPELTKVIIGSNVTEIGDYAFERCTGLMEIIIPNGVTSIGYCAFGGCSGITKITLPNSIISIGYSAFNSCRGLKEITLPNSLTSIEESVFYDCSNLTKITIPESVTSIGGYAFYGCRSLTEITIPSGVTSIGEDAFYGCSSLTKITLPNGITSINNSTFSGCSSLIKITIPSGVTSIGEYAFSGCTNLAEIILPDSIDTIGGKAFEETKFYNNLPDGEIYLGTILYGYKGQMPSNTAIVVKEGTHMICSYAFSGYRELSSIVISSSVKLIGVNIFEDCKNIATIRLKPTIPPTLKENLFGIRPHQYSATIYVPESSVEAYRNAEHWNKLTTIETYKDGSLDKFTYKGLCYETLSHTEVKVIDGEQPYSGDVIIPETVVYNEQSYRVIEIDSEAFKNCTGLATITMGSHVTEIGDRTFSGCDKLDIVYVKAKVPPIIYDNTFDFITCHATLYVPQGCEETYRNAEHWNKFSEINSYKEGALKRFTYEGLRYETLSLTEVKVIADEQPYSGEVVIPETVVYNDGTYKVVDIDDGVFRECTGLTSMVIGDNITSIKDEAFYGCRNMSSLTIGSGVVAIGQSAFSDCSKLTEITIPNSVTSIGESAFNGCSTLKMITIGNGVATIGQSAFSDCSKLTEVTIPNSVTSIGESAFNGCVELVKVTIGSGVSSIGNNAFASCPALTTLTVLAINPPAIANKNVFDDDTYLYTKLWIRYGCQKAYEEAPYWNRFAKVSELESDNHFVVEPMSASRGSDFILPVALVNDVVVAGFQADLYLPAGVDILPGNEGRSFMLTERATDSHVISAARQSDGAIKILVYSTAAEPFNGYEGVLFAVKLNVAQNFNGECLIQLRNIVLTAPDDSEYKVSDLDIDVVMVLPEKGDANSDGKINVSDINAIANYILQPERSHINLTQADVNNNDKVNVTDIVGVGHIILGNESKSSIRRSIAAEGAENSRFYIDNFDIAAGGEKSVEIILDNATAISGFQADIYLPEGLSIKQSDGLYDIALSDRMDNHTISVAKQKSGAMRILSYSVSSSEFEGNDGALVRMTLVADPNFKQGDIAMCNMIFSQSDMTEYVFENEYPAVNGGAKVPGVIAPQWQIIVSNGTLHVSGVQGSERVCIYAIDGTLMHSATVAHLSRIALPHGVYLVQVAGMTRKVVL